MTVTSTLLTAILPKIMSFLEGLPLGLWINHIWQFYLSRRFRGLYRVDAHRVSLTLCDGEGKKAIHEKEQHVTFLRDDVFAIQDQAWGDGDIFAEYQCSPGVAVDRYKEGFRWKILISFRSNKHAGDSDVIRIRRVITDGFTTSIGNFHTQIDHPHKSLTVSVVFPANRFPRRIVLVEQNARITHPLDSSYAHQHLDGSLEYSWTTNHVRLYEAYIMRWEW